MQRLVCSSSRTLSRIINSARGRTSTTSTVIAGSRSLFRSVTSDYQFKRSYSTNINHGAFNKSSRASPFGKEVSIRNQICGSTNLLRQKNYLIIRNISEEKKKRKLRKNRRKRDLLKAIKVLLEKKLDGQEIPRAVISRIEFDLENPAVVKTLEENPKNLKHTVDFYLMMIEKAAEERQIHELASKLDQLEGGKLEDLSPELREKVQKYIEMQEKGGYEIPDTPFEEIENQAARERNESFTAEEIAALEKREDEFRALVPTLVKHPAFLENIVHEGQILERPIEDDESLSTSTYGTFQHRSAMDENIMADEDEDIESDNLFAGPAIQMVYTPTGPIVQKKNCCNDFRSAVQNKHLDCLLNLVKHFQGTALNGENALHIAALMDDTTVAGKLITEKGISVNSVNNTSTTPLHLACSRGNFEMIKMLISSGSNINAVDESGITPLHLAVQAMLPVEAIEFMIKKGAKIVYRDTEGLNAIHVAALSNRPDLLKLLVAKGLSINDWTKDEETPIHLASQDGCVDFLQAALSYAHANVNAVNRYNETPLHYATKSGRAEIVELLLTSGASLNVRDIAGATPLHIAAARGYADCLKLMIQRSPTSVEQPNAEGWTPLHIAVQRGNFECVKMLLENGALVNTRNEYGYTALLLAASAPVHELEEETQKLNEGKTDADQKFMSPIEINETICQLLLAQNPDVNLADNNGQTPLMFACYNDNIPLVSQLLAHKAQVKVKRTTDHVTALHIALHEQNWEIAQMLLDAGADPTAENDEGVQPLHIAVAEQSAELTKQLLNMKIDTNCMTNDGLTPLKIAQQNQDQEIETLLRASGAKELDLFTIVEDAALLKSVQHSDARREGDEH